MVGRAGGRAKINIPSFQIKAQYAAAVFAAILHCLFMISIFNQYIRYIRVKPISFTRTVVFISSVGPGNLYFKNIQRTILSL